MMKLRLLLLVALLQYSAATEYYRKLTAGACQKPVVTADACREAADFLDLSFELQQTSKNKVPGCKVSSKNTVKFNRISDTSKVCAENQCICEQTVFDVEDRTCRMTQCGCPSTDGTMLQSWCDEDTSIIPSTSCASSEASCAACGGVLCEDCMNTVQLTDFEVWRREEGFWYGKYTFLGAEGDPYQSTSWNYPYDHYHGFIHIDLVNQTLKQRNVFVYPPSEVCDTDNSTMGEGVCGVNGNEKVFSAEQSLSDCDGNLAGPYNYGMYTLDTTTRILGDDTVIYNVKLPDMFGGGFNQNQLTTLPGNGIRVRTAQGFDFSQLPSYASFYREERLAGKAAFIEKFKEVRAELSILPGDKCGYDSSNMPSGVTCEEHFGFSLE